MSIFDDNIESDPLEDMVKSDPLATLNLIFESFCGETIEVYTLDHDVKYKGKDWLDFVRLKTKTKDRFKKLRTDLYPYVQTDHAETRSFYGFEWPCKIFYKWKLKKYDGCY